MMKKIWFLCLVLAAALFIPCSEALASPIDGMWYIASGQYENHRLHFTARIDLASVNPSEFSIKVVYAEEGNFRGYNIFFDEDSYGFPGEVTYDWVLGLPVPVPDSESAYVRLEKRSEFEYYNKETRLDQYSILMEYESSIVLLDSNTLQD